MTSHRNSFLELIELGRGLAALMVVIYHCDKVMIDYGFDGFGGYNLNFGSRGVDFFFVLSGFIIYYAHASDINDRRKLFPYIKKRAIRLFPMLWLVAAPVCIAGYFLGLFTFPEIFSTFFLYPSLEIPRPGVVWTLRHELLFYLMFAVFIFNKKLGVALSLGALLLTGVEYFFPDLISGVMNMIFSAYNVQFMAGVISAFMYINAEKKGATVNNHALILMIAAFPAALWFADVSSAYKPNALAYESDAARFWVIVFALACGMCVYALARISSIYRPKKLFVALGGASYVLYLIHLPVISVLTKLAGPHVTGVTSSLVLFLFIVCLCVFLAVIVHKKIEKPMVRLLRRKLNV